MENWSSRRVSFAGGRFVRSRKETNDDDAAKDEFRGVETLKACNLVLEKKGRASSGGN